MSRFLGFLALLLFASVAASQPAAISVPCDASVHLFGGATVQAKGVAVRGRNDFESRLKLFFRRVCEEPVDFLTLADKGATLIADSPEIIEKIRGNPGGIFLIHYPLSDLGAGVEAEAVLAQYGQIMSACRNTDSICVIGGQQPVNSYSDETVRQQLRLEREASKLLGENYLPLYRYFESEAPGRHLILRLDSGDGRLVNDHGHELLYVLYRNRLLALGSGKPAKAQE